MDAARVVAKLNVVIPSISKELHDPNVADVATFARAELVTAATRLTELFHEASEKQSAARPEPLSMTIDEITAFIKLTQAKAKNVSDLLVAVRKAKAKNASS